MAQTMFERYGGFANVSKVVMAFYDRVLDSDIVGHYFEDVDMKALVDHQTKFISAAMGGPAHYTNEMLQRAHAHLPVNKEEFHEIAGLLEETLEDFEIDARDIETILKDVKAREPFIVKSET